MRKKKTHKKESLQQARKVKCTSSVSQAIIFYVFSTRAIVSCFLHFSS